MPDIDLILVTRKKSKPSLSNIEKLKAEILKDYKKLVGNGAGGLNNLLDVNIVNEKNLYRKGTCASMMYSLHKPPVKFKKEEKMKTLSYKKQIEALSKIGKAITSYTYLDEVLIFIVSMTAEIINSKICSLLLLNEKKELIIRATQSISESYRTKNPIKFGEGIAGKVVKKNKPIVVYDVKNDSRYINHGIAEKEGLCSLLSVPLSIKGKTIGALNCYTDFPHEFTKEEISLLIMISNQAAVVIENAQLTLKTRAIKEELETRKIVERAKGMIMKRGLSEEEAFRRIQKKSMDTHKPMKEIAEAILLTAELEK
jgi:two-component system, response regulator PdtaR